MLDINMYAELNLKVKDITTPENFFDPLVSWTVTYHVENVQGHQREYIKPLKHSIVKRILVFKSTVDIGIFLSPKSFSSVRTGFPCWKSSDPKIIGIKTYLVEDFSQKKAP